MRFITGVTASDQAYGWKPRGAVPVAGAPGLEVWASGFGGEEIRAAAFEEGRVVVAGSCLATGAELERAAVAAARGAWIEASRLPGAFVALVRTGGVWRVVGDRAGTVPVYWTQAGGRSVWGTAAGPLAALGEREPDPAVLLGRLMLQGVDVLGTFSHFHGVRRVPPGHALVLEDGRRPRTEPAPPPGAAAVDFADAAPLVQDAVVEAVERRVRTAEGVSADLSGGMDSGIVASIAARRTGLLAVTYTDARMRDDDDVHYARHLAAELPGLRHRVVEGGAGEALHFGGLDDLPLLPFTDTPSFSLGLLGIKRAQLAAPVGEGSRLHLTGRGGDDVLGAVFTMAVDQFRAGQRAAAWRRVTAVARERRTSAAVMVARAARTAATPYPRALAELADRIAAGRADPVSGPARLLTWCGDTGALPWLTPNGRAVLAGLVAERAAGADGDEDPGRLHERLALEQMGDGHGTFDEMARALWGLAVHAPLLDNRVVDACHAIPGWQRARPGAFKPLAREAFTGLVPDTLLQRRTKTAFTASLYDGLRAHAPALRRILSGSRLVTAGLLDGHRATASLDAATRGETAPMMALHGLVVTELWLSLLPPGRTAWWERTGTGRVAA